MAGMTENLQPTTRGQLRGLGFTFGELSHNLFLEYLISLYELVLQALLLTLDGILYRDEMIDSRVMSIF